MKSVNRCIIILAIFLAQASTADEESAPKISNCTLPVSPVDEVKASELSDSDVEFSGSTMTVIGDVINLDGDALVQDRLRTMKADSIVFDRKTKILDAKGNVSISEPDAQFKGEEINLDLSNESMTGNSIDFLLFERMKENSENENGRVIVARGKTENIEFKNGVWELSQTSLTHCPEGTGDFLISSSEIELDTNTMMGKARNATIRVKNVPIFYTPVILFPIGEQRVSGYLFPKASYSSGDGAILKIPYYFNLAPNYDATVSANIFSKRGVQLHTEYRHLGVNSDTKILAEFLPSDRKYKNKEDRYAGKLQTSWHDGIRLYSNADVSWVSDKKYISDFSGFLGDEDENYVQQNAEVNIAGDRYIASFGMNQYVIANEKITDKNRTYDRVPWASYEHLLPLGNQFTLRAKLNADRFRHRSVEKRTATRYRTDVAVEHVMKSDFGMLELRAGGETIKYNRISNADSRKQDNYRISSKYFDADGRLFFDREFDDDEGPKVWTIEPRIKYVSASKEKQEKLPVFDTTLGSINSYEDLFRSNPYVGGDRVRDSDRISAGLSVSLHRPFRSSSIRKFGVGRIFYPRNKAPQSITESTDSKPVDTDKSDIFLGALVKESRWRADSGLLYDDESDKVNQATVKLTANFSDNRKVSGIYRYLRQGDEQLVRQGNEQLVRQGDEQLGTSLSVPLESGWGMRIEYIESLQDHRMIKSQVLFDYTSCCLNIGFSVTREREEEKLDNSFKLFINFQRLGAK